LVMYISVKKSTRTQVTLESAHPKP
jgi:hypothetical protein